MNTPVVVPKRNQAEAPHNEKPDFSSDCPTLSEPNAARLSEISDEFAYAGRCKAFRGKLWAESYAPALEIYARLAHHRNERVIEHASRGEQLLDIGCGFGDLIYYLRDRFDEVHGADPSADMAQHARENMESRGVDSPYSISQALAEHLPFEDDRFDAVLMTDTYEHIHPDQRERALAEVRRVLRPGGRFVIVTPSTRVLHAWAFVDNLLTIPRQIKLGKGVRIFSATPKAYCEVFCTKRGLLNELKAAGLSVQAFERVGFYPAPERPGFWEPYLYKLHKNRRLYDRFATWFRRIERIGLLNQKMLVCCSKAIRDRQ